MKATYQLNQEKLEYNFQVSVLIYQFCDTFYCSSFKLDLKLMTNFLHMTVEQDPVN